MTYQATAVKIMIASPSDVTDAREVIRSAIHSWNDVHAEAMNIVLMPIAWESSSSPMMGDRPQAIINEQLLKSCDVLVATFWTRLGSPTGIAASGTVEEIAHHLAAHKPALIYFSRQPVAPDSIDRVQYDALVAFREKCKADGLVTFYDSVPEFREAFSKHLAQTIHRNFADTNTTEAMSNATPDREPLTTLEQTILKEASQDKGGQLLKLRRMGGVFHVQTNGKQLVTDNTARSQAKWEATLSNLCNLGYLEDVTHKGEIFRVTDAGYSVAEGIGAP
jgi:hypothetical protein